MHRTTFSGIVLGAATAVLVTVLAACSTLTSAISSAMRPPAPQEAPADTPQQAPQEQKSSSPRQSADKGMAYQYQFNAFYGGMWNMGWMGYKDSSYKQGQGTIWKFSGSKDDSITFERALLRVNQDSTQWWRFRLDNAKESILYEFLVGPDGKAKKVRYKDPDTGDIGEFVPTEGGPGAGPSVTPKSQAEMAKYKVDRQTVKVAAGSFACDHYVYSDERGEGTAESWVSNSVPGSMVKSAYIRSKDKRTSTVELIRIESGVTTALGSY